MQAASTEETLLSGPELQVQLQEKEPLEKTVAPEAKKIREFEEKKALASHHQAEDNDYGFYDSLQASSWSVPVQRGVYLTAEDRKRASYTYILQAASLKSREEAVSLVARLQKLGMDASYSVTGGAGGEGTWYRVNVGPFNNVSVMNKAEDVLVSLHMMPLKRRVR